MPSLWYSRRAWCISLWEWAILDHLSKMCVKNFVFWESMHLLSCEEVQGLINVSTLGVNELHDDERCCVHLWVWFELISASNNLCVKFERAYVVLICSGRAKTQVWGYLMKVKVLILFDLFGIILTYFSLYGAVIANIFC